MYITLPGWSVETPTGSLYTPDFSLLWLCLSLSTYLRNDLSTVYDLRLNLKKHFRLKLLLPVCDIMASYDLASAESTLDRLLKLSSPPANISSISRVWSTVVELIFAVMAWCNAKFAPISTSGRRRARGKCSKCHAKGHASINCRSRNPAAVRKRIKANKKNNRTSRGYSSYPTSSFPTPFPSHIASSAQSAFIADAGELRRRRAQSKRDKAKAEKKAV